MITQARSDLAAFRIRYRREVGGLHEQLERDITAARNRLDAMTL